MLKWETFSSLLSCSNVLPRNFRIFWIFIISPSRSKFNKMVFKIRPIICRTIFYSWNYIFPNYGCLTRDYCIPNVSIAVATLSTQWRGRCSGGDSAGDQGSGGKGPPVSHLCFKPFKPWERNAKQKIPNLIIWHGL